MQVTIRPLQEQDAYVSVNWRNDSDVFKYTGNTYSHIISLESELEWIRRVITITDDYRCAIIADGDYVGNIYLTGIDGRSADFHIFIGEKSYLGKGVAKQASKQILDYAFNHLNLIVVRLRVRVENVRAYNLYKSLGFVEVSLEGPWISMEVSRPSNANVSRN